MRQLCSDAMLNESALEKVPNACCLNVAGIMRLKCFFCAYAYNFFRLLKTLWILDTLLNGTRIPVLGGWDKKNFGGPFFRL
jgi:hypothetical protein